MSGWLASFFDAWKWGTVPQWLVWSTALGAAFVAYRQYRSSKLFQLLQFLEKPEIWKARDRLYVEKEKGTTKKEKWWEQDHELRKAASDICASYDIVWRVAKGGHRRFFRRHWAYSICWTHETLQTFITARRNDGDKRAYEGFDKLYREALRFDPRSPRPRRRWFKFLQR
jgi:hypothetical protein